MLGFSPWMLLIVMSVAAAAADKAPVSTVGMPHRIEQIVLPGPRLEALPHDDRDLPIVLRIAGVWPHGTAWRYDLEYYGLEPGTFDLRDYLVHTDGSSHAELPPLPVTIEPTLPPGQIEPHELAAKGAPWLGGYRTAISIGFMLWGAGLVAILMLRRKQHRDATLRHKPTVSVADRLRPLIEGAVKGTVSQVELAELERTLIAYWQRQLNLRGERPAAVIAKLRAHPDAGPLVRQLEDWLHHPNPSDEVDVARLLTPYQNLPAESWMAESTPAGVTP